MFVDVEDFLHSFHCELHLSTRISSTAVPDGALAEQWTATPLASVVTDGAATGVWVIKITAPPGAWSRPTVLCNGTASSRFRILKVPTGSAQDPLNGTCKQFHQPLQNILQISDAMLNPTLESHGMLGMKPAALIFAGQATANCANQSWCANMFEFAIP